MSTPTRSGNCRRAQSPVKAAQLHSRASSSRRSTTMIPTTKASKAAATQPPADTFRRLRRRSSWKSRRRRAQRDCSPSRCGKSWSLGTPSSCANLQSQPAAMRRRHPPSEALLQQERRPKSNSPPKKGRPRRRLPVSIASGTETTGARSRQKRRKASTTRTNGSSLWTSCPCWTSTPALLTLPWRTILESLGVPHHRMKQNGSEARAKALRT
mmetsp:Transcript_7233/g.27615  ORF Transcript_7233/g.27615 Transcript_7233/m.27615 type:complete len:212 (+) Transcript_7233:582-1217(+)